MESATGRRFRCQVCQQCFSRNDHLKRHQLRHTGLKPYRCQFCDLAFARSDSLRVHYAECPQRGDLGIPATGQSGRRRHACLLCISMKLKCDRDDRTPCSSCKRRKAVCSVQNQDERVSLEPENEPAESASAALVRGSIQFLLNGGTDGWMAHFHFPPNGDRSRYQYRKDITDSTPESVAYSFNEPTGYGFVPDPSLKDDIFTSMFSDPFGFLASGYATPAVSSAPPSYPLVDPLETGDGLPERQFATNLINSITSRASRSIDDSQALDETRANLSFLLTTTRIRKFVAMYFEYWHPNARVIHPPSFDPETVEPSLLAAVVLMGALYSQDAFESYGAKFLLDIIELFCFTSSTFSADAEVFSAVSGAPSSTKTLDGQKEFEHLQACYLMVILQHWAGNRAARSRAMELRFSEVVRVARRIGMTRSRQLPEDQSSEVCWLRKESRLRTMHYIVLIDCAFSFFQNYPCRLTPPESEFDLPCRESLFDSKHPYEEPNFRYSRGATLCDAFKDLFRSSSPASCLQRFELTVLDMFLLIHVLYAHTNTHMTVIAPLMQLREPCLMEDDSTIKALKNALSKWRALWIELANSIPQNEWALMGFWKFGYHYWLIAQLLISKKDKVDTIMRMDFGEDKLEKLKLLLQDDSD